MSTPYVVCQCEELRAENARLREQQEPVAWKHTCNALCVNGLELWIDKCPHCGKPRQKHPAEDAEDAKYKETLQYLAKEYAGTDPGEVAFNALMEK